MFRFSYTRTQHATGTCLFTFKGVENDSLSDRNRCNCRIGWVVFLTGANEYRVGRQVSEIADFGK